MRSTSKVVETVWIFEKDTSNLFDDTPIYEGVIIEYLHRVEVSQTYVNACMVCHILINFCALNTYLQAYTVVKLLYKQLAKVTGKGEFRPPQL